MWWRSLVLAAALVIVAGCQVRPLYSGGATGALSPQPELARIVIDPPQKRIEQVLRNELLFLFRGSGADAIEPVYDLRLIVSQSRDNLAVALEEDLPAAVLVSVNATFILSERATERTLLTGSANSTASYDFSSSRFANVRAEKDAGERAARSMAENIAARIAAYFAARSE